MKRRKAKAAALIVSFPLLLIALAALLALPPKTAANSDIYFVGGPRSPSDDNSCISTCHPCATIQGAIDKATGGDEIRVYLGTYTETLVIAKALTLKGGYWLSAMGDCPDIADVWSSGYSTTVNDQAPGSGVVYASSNLDLSNFILTGGSYGGIFTSADITITDVTVRDNTGGPGIEVGGGNGADRKQHHREQQQ